MGFFSRPLALPVIEFLVVPRVNVDVHVVVARGHVASVIHFRDLERERRHSRQESYNRGMDRFRRLTAIIEREEGGYVSLCPEVDVASQGDTIEEARANLIEALTLFFEEASEEEIKQRMHNEVLVTQVEVPVGQTA